MNLKTKGVILAALVFAVAIASISAVAADDQDRLRECDPIQDRTHQRLMDNSCCTCPCDGTCDCDCLKTTQ